MANNFLPFCPTDTGTNLLSQGAYAAASDRTNGNQPGIASARLNNKAIRQATYVVSQLAQYMADLGSVDLLDDAAPATLLAQFKGAFLRISPVITRYLSGSGTYHRPYAFIIASGSAEAGATYTNNTQTFTVLETVSSGTLIKMTGTGAPSAAGTLTKASGTGDATLTFFFVRIPTVIEVELVGGGGGGAGGGVGAGGGGGNGGNGAQTDFGTILVANGGSGGTYNGNGGAGGTASIGSGAHGIALKGGNGAGYIEGTVSAPSGAASAFGGEGSGSEGGATAGGDASANTGAGGGGGGAVSSNNRASSGGSGGYLHAFFDSVAATYGYEVGTGGSAGTKGSDPDDSAGGAGAAGMILVTAHFN